MNKEEILNNLQEIARIAFNDSKLNIDENTVLENIYGWNSLSHIMFMDYIEKKFNIQFTFEDMLNFSSIASIQDALMKKTGL